jgi:hypothetical protein
MTIDEAIGCRASWAGFVTRAELMRAVNSGAYRILLLEPVGDERYFIVFERRPLR